MTNFQVITSCDHCRSKFNMLDETVYVRTEDNYFCRQCVLTVPRITNEYLTCLIDSNRCTSYRYLTDNAAVVSTLYPESSVWRGTEHDAIAIPHVLDKLYRANPKNEYAVTYNPSGAYYEIYHIS